MEHSTMEIRQDQLQQILPGNPYIEHWCEALNKILPDYDIDTPQRVAAFLAQTAHESGGYNALHENLNYKAESLCKVWPRYFNAGNANDYAHQPEKIANRAYANRMGNGDEASGDGWRYCGRGLLQVTGKSNYQAFADSVGMAVEDAPEFLQTFEGAIQSACWFWEANNLNQYADSGDFVTMTKRINGGTLGLDDRTNRYNRAVQVLSA
jgi:putative chitinase